MTLVGEGTAPAIEATGIERRFGRLRVLRGLDLVVDCGTTVALFGPNGAGKTTLLRILARVLRPSAGQFRIHGLDPAAEAESVLRTLGYLPHEIALYLDLTPEENLTFQARLFGLKQARERVREVLASVGLAERAVPVRELSRGLQQRTALARVLLHRPRLLLLDEPWTGLDPEAQRVLAARLDEHRREGGTTVLTTHDLRRGHQCADRLALVGGGKIVFDGKTTEVSLHELEKRYEEAAGASR